MQTDNERLDEDQTALIQKATPWQIKLADRLLVVGCIILIVALGVWGYFMVMTLAQGMR